MRILVHGAGGHMGRIISGMAAEGRCGAELIARVSPELQADPEAAVFTALDDFTGEADCVIDLPCSRKDPGIFCRQYVCRCCSPL